MYDYRNDLIQLLLKTKNTPDSLAQTALALGIISKSLFSEKSSVLDDKSLARVKDLIDKKEEAANKPVVTTVAKKPIEVTEPESTQPATQPTQLAQSTQITQATKLKKKIVVVKRPEPVHLDPIQAALKSLPAGQYLIIDKLSGCVARNKKGMDVAYFTEGVKRQNGLVNGDVVTLNHDVNTDRYYIKSIISKAEIPDQITMFPYAKIEKDALGLYVSRNVNNEQLSNINKKHTRYNIGSLVIAKFGLKEGDIIDLAWYNETPDKIMIVWKYSDEALTQEPEEKKPQKHSDYVEKTVETKAVKPKLDFDLDGKTVAFVTADDSVSGKVEELAKLHNGKATVVEAINGGKVIDHLASFDIIILLQNYISHEVTRPIIAKFKGEKAIALAEGAGQLSIEKAMYRASRELGVNDNAFIAYPMASDED